MPKKSGRSSAADHIKMAIDGIDAEIRDLTQKREQLAKMVGAAAAATAAPSRGKPAAAAGRKRKRTVSEATKRKLRAAAKARWARIRAEKKAKGE
jgi:chorismate mutase